MPAPACPPVLLIFFNRPNCAERTLTAIRAARPTRLYLACDGPRPDVPSDASGRAATLSVVERLLDWPCVVQRDYSSVNLGVTPRVTSAISWFFTHEESGMVFEDDCVPHPSFFPFCAEVLARYATDARIGLISGNQFVPGGWACADGADYTFVRLSQIWGWASWRRTWQLYDRHPISEWPAAREAGLLERTFPRARDRRYWRARFDDCATGRFFVWDFHWSFARWQAGQVGIVPAQNLCTYIGFRPEAAHTTEVRHPAGNIPLVPAPAVLRHPARFALDDRLDRATARILFSTGSLRARVTFRLRQLGRLLTGRFFR